MSKSLLTTVLVVLLPLCATAQNCACHATNPLYSGSSNWHFISGPNGAGITNQCAGCKSGVSGCNCNTAGHCHATSETCPPTTTVAKCDSFSSCAHSSLNKGSGVSCTGDASTCDVGTCCNQPAKCDSFSGCAHSSLNKGSGVSCTGDASTCNVGTCCNQPATCNQFTGCSDDSFFKKNLGSTVQCAGASSTCNVETCCEGNHCDITDWGTGLPFSTDDDRPKFSLTDGDILDVAEFKIAFKLATQTCVDNKNWLDLTLHDTQTPKCVEATQGQDNGCTALSDDEEACNGNSKCRYRIPCESSVLGESDAAPFTVTKEVSTRTTGPTQDTAFTIKIDTEKLDDAENIYVKATADSPLAKLEFCVRAAVSVDVPTSDSTTSHEILYREIVLRTAIGMDGSFSLDVASDSFDEDSVQEVDNTLSVTAQGFACEQDGSVYKKLDTTPTLVPNSLFTLCVVPTSTSVKCDDIETLTFKQDRSNAGGSASFSEDRIANKVPANFLLTSDPAVETVEVVEDGTTTQHIGCVVNSRLEAAYFVALAPNAIQVSGSAMLAFKASSRGRNLREESAHSSMAMTVFGKRSLQEEEQAASFDVQFKLARNQENEVTDNNRRVDAADHIGGYCLATAFAAVAASNMI